MEGGESREGRCEKILMSVTCIQGNAIQEEGVAALARALEHNSTIMTLDLGVCKGRGDVGRGWCWILT